MIITAAGTATGIAPGDQLWIFVEYLPSGPLLPAAIVQDGEHWTAEELHVGGTNQVGQRFVLHLTNLDTAAQQKLDDYFADEHASGTSPGLPRRQLNTWGVDFLTDVPVTRAR